MEQSDIVELLKRIADDNGRSMSAEIRGAIRTTLAGEEYRARIQDDELQDRLLDMARASLRAQGLDSDDDRDREVDQILAAWKDELGLER